MGKIYLYTGNGAGKTTNAFGLALRAMGHDKNVLVIQFLKWEKNIGEYKFQWKTSDPWIPEHLEVHQFGREGWHGFGNLTQEDKNICLKGLDFTLDLLNGKHGKKRFDLLILDEINLVTHLKLIDMHEILRFLIEITYKYPYINIVLTGRHAPKELMEIADVVNVICEVKAPKEMIYEEGIQY